MKRKFTNIKIEKQKKQENEKNKKINKIKNKVKLREYKELYVLKWIKYELAAKVTLIALYKQNILILENHNISNFLEFI